ncbi:MAG: hypothetical protein ABSC06_30640 [Rhodopila sp.]|jgi:hypothetical protein
MTATVAQLGARALRKLGVAIVADASRAAADSVTTAAAIAARVLLELGIPVAESARPAAAAIVAQPDLASRALRAVGVNPAAIGTGTATGITYTATALATASLLKLAVISAEETPSALDQAEAVARVSDVHDILVGADYVTWSVAAIPAAVAEFYIVMASNLLAPEFGKPANMDAFTGAQAMIRQQALSGANGQALAVAKVAEVHEVLNTAGLVSWLITAVPSGLAEAYVRMTAVLLAPVFGYQQDGPGRAADQGAWDAALTSVKRAAAIAGAQARAQDKVEAVQQEINALGLVTWTTAAIPAAVADPMAAMAAMQMGPEFGREMDPKLYAFHQSRIRLVSMGGPSGQALAEQKVMAAHYSLEARGLTRWTIYDLPVYAEEDLVLMAAVLLAPECGVKADPNWSELAERDLMRIVSLPSEREPVRATYF